MSEATKKASAKPEARTAAEVSAVTAAAPISGDDTEPAEDAPQPVALIRDLERRLPLSKNFIKITAEFNGTNCNLSALINTDSPISFVREDIFQVFVSRDKKMVYESSRKFMALNNLPITICGVINTKINFEKWPNHSFDIELQILKGNDFINAFIIGRNFLQKEKVTVVYKHEAEREELTQLFTEFNVCKVSTSLEVEINDWHIDFDNTVKSKLKNLILETEKTDVTLIENDYFVRVNLK